jgi:hypothetical protein
MVNLEGLEFIERSLQGPLLSAVSEFLGVRSSIISSISTEDTRKGLIGDFFFPIFALLLLACTSVIILACYL